jgi:hypothetical protein
MSVLHKEQRARAQRALDTQRGLYRNELARVAREREASLEQADAAMTRIRQMLPGALQAGVSVVELAQITGLSRPTLYRLLADARQQQDLRGLAVQLEDVIARVTGELGRSALIADLVERLETDNEELRERLTMVAGYISGELDALGSPGLTLLVELLPEAPKVERIVLTMLFLQRLPVEEVARSVEFGPEDVVVWASLGLLRLLPKLREQIVPSPSPASAGPLAHALR